MFNKKEWVIKNLKSGFDTNQFTKEYVMTISMQYSMAGVLDDNDLAELANYTEPVVEDVIIPDEMSEDITDTTEPTVDEPIDTVTENVEVTEDGAEDEDMDIEVTESE